VAVTGASNVTGEALPLEDVVALAHAAGARVLVDGAQLVPHRRFSLASSGADYVAFSGHKLYAPFGAGVLAGRADWLRAADPYLKGGGASASVGRTTRWAPSAEQRHEAGSPNVLGAIALAAACDTLRDCWEPLRAAEEALVGRLRAGLAELPSVRELTLWGDRAPRVGIVSFVVDGWNARDVALTLSEEYGIGVRDGKFCAHPFVRHLLDGDDRGCSAGGETAVRASIGIGTTGEHIDRLLAALAALAAR
jgi:selenocysteine lyase/cysteine desulfurase